MSVTVVNAGVWERNSGGNKNTKVNSKESKEETGTVRAVYEGIEHVFAPGQSKTFADDGVGIGVAAVDARLRVVDTREGFTLKTKRT